MSIRSINIAQIRFSWRPFKNKWLKPISRTKIIPRNIVNNIARKPLIQIRVVGVHGDQFWPMGYLCQLLIKIWIKIEFAEVKMAPILNFAWSLLQVILKPFPIDPAPWKIPYWTFWSSKLANLCKPYWHNRFFRMASGGHFENRFPELLPWSSMSTQVLLTPGVVP